MQAVHNMMHSCNAFSFEVRSFDILSAHVSVHFVVFPMSALLYLSKITYVYIC